MNTAEQGKGIDQLDASLVRAAAIQDEVMVHGRFEVECFDRDGNLKWRDTIENVVTYLGKNHMLDNDLQTSVAIVGPYIGLISSVSYSGGPVIGDTMASHSGWTEAGATNAPTYTAPRKTCAWNAAANGIKALSAALAFVFTGGGTVKGCFLVYGTGALSTIDNTAGTLFSAGTFTGGDKVVIATDTLNVSYSVSL
jgi:hypothetical protein